MVDLEKMKKAREKLKAHSKRIAKDARDRRPAIKRIDWRDVGDGFLEGVQPGSKEWRHIEKIIQRGSRDVERKKLITKLGRETLQIYAKYRRAAQRRDGQRGRYVALHGEPALARKVAVNCILRGVHPAKLFEYWDDSEKMGWMGVRCPPLSYLSSVHAVESVALAEFENPKRTLKAKKERRVRPEANNSFSDTEGLDPRLRPGLTAAGFDLQRCSDRFLLTVMWMAVEKAKGNNMFIPKYSKEYPMVVWAKENLYAGEVERDED